MQQLLAEWRADMQQLLAEWRTALLRLPSWRTIMYLNLAIAGLCASAAYFVGPSWSGIVDAFVAGSCASGAWSAYLHGRTVDQFYDLRHDCNDLRNMNSRLIAQNIRLFSVIEQEIANATRHSGNAAAHDENRNLH